MDVTTISLSIYLLIGTVIFFWVTTNISTNQVACAQSNLKRCTLELGGKSPLVVFDDVDDFEDAVSTSSITVICPFALVDVVNPIFIFR